MIENNIMIAKVISLNDLRERFGEWDMDTALRYLRFNGYGIIEAAPWREIGKEDVKRMLWEDRVSMNEVNRMPDNRNDEMFNP